MDGYVFLSNAFVFWDCGTSANSTCRFAKFLTTLQCEVRLTRAEFPDKTSPSDQHHRPHLARGGPAWYDMSGIGATSVDTFWSVIQCMISWNTTFNLIVSPDITRDVVTSCKMKRHETECMLASWQDRLGQDIEFLVMTMQEERLHETSWYIMTWLSMTRHQMSLHARTPRAIPTRRMEWHATTWHDMRRHANGGNARPWFLRSHARVRLWGTHAQDQQGHHRPISAREQCRRWRCCRVGQRPQGETWDAFSWSTHTCFFSRHCQGSACDTHSSWFLTVCEK